MPVNGEVLTRVRVSLAAADLVVVGLPVRERVRHVDS